jgi:FSR family fosmidomycin resistance protein-like MFS transporter
VYSDFSMKQRERKILGAVSIFHAFNDASVVALPTVLPILYTQGVLIKRYADIGTMILIGLAMAILCQFVIGHRAKGRHYRRLLALDNLVVGLFLMLTPLARHYFVLVLFYLGVRIGSSIYHPVGIAWISHSFRGKRLDRAMGIQSAFGDIGVLAAFLATGYLAQHFGWMTPLFVWGSLNLAAAAAGLLWSRGADRGEGYREPDEPVSWKETFSDQKYLLMPILLGGIAWGIMLAYGPSLLNHRLGAPMSATGLILGGWIGGGAVTSFLYGKVVDRIGRYRTLVLGCVLTALATCVIGLSTNLALTAATMAFFGMSIFITFPAFLALVSASAKSKNRTAAFSMVSNLQIIGNCTFTFVGGFMSDAWGIHTPFLLLGAVSLVIAIYVVALRNRVAVPLSEEAPEGIQEIRP